MTVPKIRLLRPDGKPLWLIYGVRRVHDDVLVYIGRTISPLWARWGEHAVYAAKGAPRLTPLVNAIRNEGAFAFRPEELVCCLSERDAAWTEDHLITAFNTLHPNGLNSAAAIKGGKRSADFQERHTAAVRAGFANRTDAQRERSRVTGRRNGEISRLIWQNLSPEERQTRRERIKETVFKGKETLRAKAKQRWADPDQRPRLLAGLRGARARSIRNRAHARHARIKDSRQTDLL